MDEYAPSRNVAMPSPEFPALLGSPVNVLVKEKEPLPWLAWKSIICRRIKFVPNLMVWRPRIQVKFTTGLKVFSSRMVGIDDGPPVPLYPAAVKIGTPWLKGTWFEFGTPSCVPSPGLVVSSASACG